MTDPKKWEEEFNDNFSQLIGTESDEEDFTLFKQFIRNLLTQQEQSLRQRESMLDSFRESIINELEDCLADPDLYGAVAGLVYGLKTIRGGKDE